MKGKLELKDGIVHVQGRLTVSDSLFYIGWFCGCTIGGLILFLRLKHPWTAIPLTLAGLGFGALNYYWGLGLEKRRLIEVYEEIKK